ncbi:MAG: hypothetical protein NTV79_01940 [Candidatus Aureabacteria bacterium]|nr:hypothetical protein [Candidatus Auribacterota bacterium]
MRLTPTDREEEKMKSVTMSFVLKDKTVTLVHELNPGEGIQVAVETLLAEAGKIAPPNGAAANPNQLPADDTANFKQIKALYAKAGAAGWEKERVRDLLKKAFGTSEEKEIIGKAGKKALSRLIDEVDAASPDFGTATPAQLKALWAKALGKGWDRERVKSFLREKLQTSEEREIVGKADRKFVSALIAQVAA